METTQLTVEELLEIIGTKEAELYGLRKRVNHLQGLVNGLAVQLQRPINADSGADLLRENLVNPDRRNPSDN